MASPPHSDASASDGEAPSSPIQFRQCRNASRDSQSRKFLVARPVVNRSHHRAGGDSEKLKFLEMIYVVATTPLYATTLAKVVDTAENDHLARALVNVGRAANTLMAIMWGLLQSEFETDKVNSILRGNSLCTKLETIFCRLVGQEFLQQIFGQSLLLIVTDTSLRLDTTSAVDNKLVDENRARVVEIAQEFVDCFTSDEAIAQTPTAIRGIASYTAELARKHAPDRMYPLVGGFMLLRFFNPAIIAPESLGLIPEDIQMDKSTRSNLILITKLLQKLSNEVLVDDSDPQAWMNDFIRRNKQRMRDYYDKLIADPDALPGETPYGRMKENEVASSAAESLFRRIELRHVTFLHRILLEHANSIFHQLSKSKPVNRNGVLTNLDVEFLRMMMTLGRSSGREDTARSDGSKMLWLPPRRPSSTMHNSVNIQDIELEVVKKQRGEFVPRFGQTAVRVGDSALVFGGCGEDGNTVPRGEAMLRFDIAFGRFAAVSAKKGDHPLRYYHSAVEYRGYMYIFGGMYNNVYLNDMHRFELETCEWEEVTYSGSYVPDPRIGHSMVQHQSSLYLFGGYVFDGKKYSYDNNIIEFDLVNNTWACMTNINAPCARVHSSVVVYRDCMWLYGGRNESNDSLQDVYRYTFETKTWKIAGCRGDIPEARWGASLQLVLSAEGHATLILFAGCDMTQTFSDVHVFHFDTQTWEKVNITGIPVSMHSTVAYAGHMYVLFGGTYSTTGTLSAEYQDLAVEMFHTPPSQFPIEIGKLFCSSSFSDLTIVRNDGIKIPAHKCIISARCPLLMNEFGNQSTVRLVDIDAELLSIFIGYLYTDSVPHLTSLKKTDALVRLFLRYRVLRPVRILEQRLQSMINPRTVLQVLTIGEDCNLRGLKHTCFEYIRENPSSVSHAPELAECKTALLAQIANALFPPKVSEK